MTHIAGLRPVRTIPVYVGLLALACLGIPVTATVLWGGKLGEYELLLWMTALLPPFLLAYYRGWTGAAVALAAGMAALSVTHAGLVWQAAEPRGWIPMAVSLTLITVSLGAGWLGELLWRKVLLAERNGSELSLVVDGEGRIRFTSASVEQHLGAPANQLEGTLLTSLAVSDEDVRGLDTLLAQPGSAAGIRFAHAGGEPRTYEVISSPAGRRRGVNLTLLVARDVTARRAAEEQQRRVQTMRAVSRIVGGVAHETNNLLTALNGHLHALNDALPPGELRQLEVNGLRARGERVGSLVRQLVGFTRQSDLRVQPVFLNGFIQQRMPLLQKLLPEGVPLGVAFADEGGFLRIDPVGLTEALVSIVSNAADATRSGGEVEVRTYREVIGWDDVSVWPFPVRMGTYLAIEVADSGVGMSEDVLRRALEPFFTTRPAPGALGLGLSAAYGFVKQSGGYLWLDSAPGRGTTATIYLPEQPAEQVADTAPLPSDWSLPGTVSRVRTVLLVEDDPLVLSYMRSVLLREGYIVLEATDGLDALQQFGHAGVDILLADVGLPRLRGDALLLELRAQRPALPAVLTSGVLHTGMLDERVFEGPTGLLEKPFSPVELLATLHEALDAVPEDAVGGRALPVA